MASLIDSTMFILGLLSFIWSLGLRGLLIDVLSKGKLVPIDNPQYIKSLQDIQEIVSEDLIQYYFAVNFMCLMLKC